MHDKWKVTLILYSSCCMRENVKHTRKKVEEEDCWFGQSVVFSPQPASSHPRSQKLKIINNWCWALKATSCCCCCWGITSRDTRMLVMLLLCLYLKRVVQWCKQQRGRGRVSASFFILIYRLYRTVHSLKCRSHKSISVWSHELLSNGCSECIVDSCCRSHQHQQNKE